MIGRVAIVTGASAGLGASIARRLAADGSTVVLAARNVEAMETVAGDIHAAGGHCLAVRCDVTHRPDIDAVVNTAVAEFGRLDIVVNNAGINRDSLIHKMTDDDWDSVIATHLTGSFLMARAAQRVMVAQHYGKIVFIGSTASAGNRGQVNYSAAKAGLEGMTRTLALELGPFGINVNCVAPGHIDEGMTRSLADRLGVDYEEIRKDRIASNAIKRVGTGHDIASAVSYLVSDDAGYVTGQVLKVSGKP